MYLSPFLNEIKYKRIAIYKGVGVFIYSKQEL